MSCYRLKWFQNYLIKIQIKAKATDSRKLIKTDGNFGNAQPNLQLSKDNVKQYFKEVIKMLLMWLQVLLLQIQKTKQLL